MTTTERLVIAAVYKREPIWNPASILYRNSGVLKKLWQQIAEELSMDAKTVRSKWKNMRANFFKHKRTLDRLGKDNHSRSIATNYPSPLYNDLLFLEDVFNKHPNHSLTKEEYEILENLKESRNQNQEKTRVPKVTYQKRASASSSFDPLHHQSPPLKKHRRTSCSNESDEQCPQLEGTDETESDSDLLYLKSLLPFMKEFPLNHKLRVRYKIQELILEELDSMLQTDDLATNQTLLQPKETVIFVKDENLLS